ncbi:alkylglycerol monooxygenase [Catalinimonas alkaloidigena]|uniref:sterol desaturase family protein n=1 Tax=Catalinimonas alkaloidigena TaxID=1075417 RepID=UPI0024073B31|nr:sterol desaturase family protein [Catalinimonas alkaloidigena]MDF9796137.1 alkylglycerol monooxygenase [Catalinimonas alkaloidigena]
MDINPIILSIPIYFLLIGIELIIQVIQKRKLYRLNDALTNMGCGVTQQVSALFFKVIVIAMYQLVYEYLAIIQIPVNWWTIAILFVLVDFCYYWAHRMSHEVNLFWGGHVVHHQSEDYNLSVALRQGSFQVLWTSIFYLPLAFLGFDTLTFVTVSAFVTLYQFWIHTETIGKMGGLEWIFNTPSHHRVHHGRDPKYIDKNHAGVFIIWDRLFGTFQEEEEKPTYGVTQPLDSWNPIWANLKPYIAMGKQLQQTPRWDDRMRILFKRPGWRPGWRPANIGGYQAPQEVDKNTYRKYDVKGSPRLNYYIFFQYIIALLGTALFLFTEAQLLMPEKVAMAGLVLFSLLSLGSLFEKPGRTIPLEIVRIVCTLLAVLYFGQNEQWINAILVFGSSYVLISTYWLYTAVRAKKSSHSFTAGA